MAPEIWKRLIDTYNEETSIKLVEILKRRRYNASYNSSKKTKRVWLREDDWIIKNLIKIILKHVNILLKGNEDGAEAKGIVIRNTKFLYDEIPDKTFLEEASA